MSNPSEGITVVNGNFSLLSEAKIPITDRGFLFGHAVFETILVSNGKIVAWEKHISRLKQSCIRSYIQQPNEETLKKLSIEAIEKNIKLTNMTSQKMSLRIIVTGGNSADFPIKKINGEYPNPNIIIICRNIAGPSNEQYTNGISLKSVFDVRPKELIDIKSCNYLFNIMSLEEANSQNFEDVLFYDNEGFYTESTTANFIWFDENYHVYSAPFKNNCLAGTTLILLVEALYENSVPFQWKSLEKEKLNSIAGCAILSSTRLILPVKKIDDNLFAVEKYAHFFKDLNKLLEQKISGK